MPGCNMERGEQVMLDCELPDTQTPVTTNPDLSYIPALLALVPAIMLAPPVAGGTAQPAGPAPPPQLPVYLAHLALLL